MQELAITGTKMVQGNASAIPKYLVMNGSNSLVIFVSVALLYTNLFHFFNKITVGRPPPVTFK
jgi:hypothetical protein